MPTVLVVDDSATIRRVIRRSLTLAGLTEDQIVEAVDGVDALESIRRQRPAVVLSDVNMPRLSGLDLLRALREDPSTADLPVVVITSVSNSRDLLEIVRMGASKVIRKPFDPTSLPNALAPFLPSTAEPAPRAASVVADLQPLDQDPLTSAVRGAVGAVVERMLFSLAIPTQADGDTGRVLIGAEILVDDGPFTALSVAVNLSTARMLAERTLGEPLDGDDDAACVDCVAELANVLVGEVLQQLEGSESVARFGLPLTFARLPGQVGHDMECRFTLDDDGPCLHVRVAA